MAASFRWLHLTDLHWGSDEQETRWNDFKDDFFEGVRRLSDPQKCGGPWDVVFFTGDLVYKGTAEEFDRLNQFLLDIWPRFEVDGKKPILVPVPGNHDLARPDLDGPYEEALAIIANAFDHEKDEKRKAKLRDKVWKKKEESSVWKAIEQAFANYQKWWDTLPDGIPKMNPTKIGLLPGEFSTTLTKDDYKIGVLGLNSAFLQLEAGNYEGKLAMNPAQTRAALGDASKWQKSHHANILLTHHPLSWFSPKSQEEYLSYVSKPGRFMVHLSGHTHQQAVLSIQKGGSEVRNMVSTLSLFGSETFGDEEKGLQEMRVFGFGAGRIDFGTTEATCRIWAKEADEIDGGGFDFVNVRRQRYENDDSIRQTITCDYPTELLQKKEPKKSQTKPVVLKKGSGTQHSIQNGSGSNQIRQFVKEALESILKHGHFQKGFLAILLEVLNQPESLAEKLVDNLTLSKALISLEKAIHQYTSDQDVPLTKAMLEDFELLVGWLAVLGLKDEWHAESFQGIDFIVPVSSPVGLEVVVSKMTKNAASFSYDSRKSDISMGKGFLSTNISTMASPLATDWLDQIKRDLWVAIAKEQEHELYELEGKSGKKYKPFNSELNERLVQKIKIQNDVDRYATPYLLVNPNREDVSALPPDVLAMLRRDLEPLKIICFTAPDDIWQSSVNEAGMREQIAHVYKTIHQAYDMLKG